MAMGVTSDDDFDNELAKLNNNNDKVAKVVNINVGRGAGNNQVPESLRKVIAEDANLGTPAKELSDIYGVSKQSVDAYAHGATSCATYNTPNTPLRSHINSVKERVVRKASRSLINSLNTITPESLKDIGPVKAASVARDMSTIIKNMEPEVDNDGVVNNNIIFYAPRLKTEDEFEYINEQGQLLIGKND
jgi:hypothetical protein